MRPRPGVSEPAACRHVFHVGQFDHAAEVGAGREERAKMVGTVDGGGFVIRKSRPEPRRSQLGDEMLQRTEERIAERRRQASEGTDFDARMKAADELDELIEAREKLEHYRARL